MDIDRLLSVELIHENTDTVDNVHECIKCNGINQVTVKLSEPVDNGTEHPDVYDTVFDTTCSSCGHIDVHAYGNYESKGKTC